MKLSKRLMLKSLLTVGAVMAFPRWLFASRPDAAFATKNVSDAIQQLYNDSATASDLINLKVPDIAENGAVVPVTISTSLENVESISVIVDNNPTALAAVFNLTPQARPDISLRIKMGQSSPVRAVVKAGGKVYETSKEVKVTIGGCGG